VVVLVVRRFRIHVVHRRQPSKKRTP